MKLIEIKDVSIRFDSKPILDNVSLTIDKGDFVAITGPNGGGKTTLLRIMLKLLRPDSGSVTYYSDDGTIDRHPKIGYLPQKSNIDVRFPITVAETIRSGQITGLFHRSSPKEEEDFRHAVELCGVGEYLDRNVGVLSGGMLQRTLMARAIVSNPDIIMLDEPLSYVDKNFERQIYSIMEKQAKERTIIFVSHEISVISGMANRHIEVNRKLTFDEDYLI